MPTMPIADDVAAEMGRIFQPLTDRPQPSKRQGGNEDDRSSKTTASEWRRIALVAPLSIVVLTTAFAINYTASRRPATLAAAPEKMLPQPQGPSDRAGAQALAQREPASPLKPRSAILRDHIEAEMPEAAASKPAVLTKLDHGITSPGSPRLFSSTTAGAAVLRSTPTSSALRSAATTTAVIAAQRSTRSLTNPPSTPIRCTSDSEDNGCIYADVLNADAMLRRAYDRAERAGVSKLYLSAIIARWTRVRRNADDDPDGTIARYNRLTRALTDKVELLQGDD